MKRYLFLIAIYFLSFSLQAQNIKQSSDDFTTASSSNSIGKYTGFAEIGYTHGVGEFGVNVLEINIINGFQVTPYLVAGLGTGARYFYVYEGTLVPIFAELRFVYPHWKLAPFLVFDLGYSIDVFNHFKGMGMMVNPSAGVSYELSRGSRIFLEAGYEMQQLQLNYSNGATKNVNAAGIGLVLGFTF